MISVTAVGSDFADQKMTHDCALAESKKQCRKTDHEKMERRARDSNSQRAALAACEIPVPV